MLIFIYFKVFEKFYESIHESMIIVMRDVGFIFIVVGKPFINSLKNMLMNRLIDQLIFFG
jgi:hypothetical protein